MRELEVMFGIKPKLLVDMGGVDERVLPESNTSSQISASRLLNSDVPALA